MISKAYKFRIYPNLNQQQQLRKEFAGAKVIYNYYLEKSINSYKEEGKSLNYYDWAKDLTNLKKTEQFLWLSGCSNALLQDSLRDLDTAYKNFFRRVKKGDKQPGFPKFKKFNSSVRYSNAACYYKAELHKIRLSKVGLVKVIDYVEAKGRLLNITVSLSKAGIWYASICVETTEPNYENTSTSEVGLDIGIKSFISDSNGNKIDSPKFYDNSQKKRARLQRALARKQRGSANRKKALLKLAKFEAKVAAQRSNFLHQTSTRLVKENKFIAVEDLNVKGMSKAVHGKGKAGKSGLNRRILDGSWGEFYRQLGYKGTWYNCKVVQIGRFEPTSKTCFNCGYKNDSLTLNDRVWTCPQCGETLDRDTNAAKNILKLGLDKVK